MPRSKNETPAPSKTAYLFAGRKPRERSEVTHETLTADIAAFRNAGGTIEVLGTTRSLLRIGREGDEPPPPLPVNPSPARRRR
jgi:hypothetical protein